ncbi:MAG: protein TolR [Thermodesulfobacteriota bacterium]
MSRQNRNKKHSPVANINVTPLVDVMLVLLIIFMITAPMLTEGINVDLPETTATPLKQEKSPLVISVNSKGEIAIGEIRGNMQLLKQELVKLIRSDPDKTILLKADKKVDYGHVARVMAEVKEAGFNKLGMVTTAEEEKTVE